MRVALVHDYLTQHGGAERVLTELHAMYPEAPIFTALADPALVATLPGVWQVRESPLGHLPGARRHHRLALPFYPVLFRSFQAALAPFDVIISDSSAWAHQVAAPPHAVHLCYCHSPARFLYRDASYLEPAGIPGLLQPITSLAFASLRHLDQRAARRVDRYLANSRTVARRIAEVYGREAPVVYPPVDLARFTPSDPPPPPEPWYLVVSRLVPHKRIDLAVAACTRADLPLKVIGDGRAAADLRRLAGPSVAFLGRLDDDAVVSHLQRCRALILPGVEDLGLTAIEAQAAGRPVVALGAGGALETVIDGETGVLFSEGTVDALVKALVRQEQLPFEPARALANAARFSRDRFQMEIRQQVTAALATKHATHTQE